MSKSIVLGLSILFVWIISWGCEHRTRCYDDRQPMAGLGISFCEPRTYHYNPDDTDRYYTPEQIQIKPGMILNPEFNISKTVTIINAQTNTDWRRLGAFTHRWWGNLRMWTDTAVALVTNELKKRGVAVKEELPLILRLDMVSDKKAPVLFGVLSMGCLLDTDRDGVPQYLDRCPNTPQGVKVDSRGCPLDTDGDGVPDHRDRCPKIPRGFMNDRMDDRTREPGIPGDVSKDMFGPSEAFLISSRPADTIIDLFKSALERGGTSIDRDTPDMLSFYATASEWATRSKSIKTALKNEGIQLTERMPRVLQLAITDVSLIWEPRKIGCRLNLRVITGDGDILDFQGTNFAIDLDDSCDGAVTKEVTAMFNNARIRSYLAAPTEPKDSDCDGVPDEIDECPGTPLGVKVDSRGCPLDTDGDGVPDYQDKCPGTPKGVNVDSRGCPLDTDSDGVPDYRDKCPGTPKGARVDKEGCWVIHEAFFDFAKYEIKPRFYPIFDEVVAVLNSNPSLKIVIEGYTDNIGTEAYNQKLSEERAKAVKTYLVKKGIQSNRLSTVGYGFSRPGATNKTSAGRALNRRVKLEPLPNQAK